MAKRKIDVAIPTTTTSSQNKDTKEYHQQIIRDKFGDVELYTKNEDKRPLFVWQCKFSEFKARDDVSSVTFTFERLFNEEKKDLTVGSHTLYYRATSLKGGMFLRQSDSYTCARVPTNHPDCFLVVQIVGDGCFYVVTREQDQDTQLVFIFTANCTYDFHYEDREGRLWFTDGDPVWQDVTHVDIHSSSKELEMRIKRGFTWYPSIKVGDKNYDHANKITEELKRWYEQYAVPDAVDCLRFYVEQSTEHKGDLSDVDQKFNALFSWIRDKVVDPLLAQKHRAPKEHEATMKELAEARTPEPQVIAFLAFFYEFIHLGRRRGSVIHTDNFVEQKLLVVFSQAKAIYDAEYVPRKGRCVKWMDDWSKPSNIFNGIAPVLQDVVKKIQEWPMDKQNAEDHKAQLQEMRAQLHRLIEHLGAIPNNNISSSDVANI